jgi:hypothetical protein
MSSSRVSFDPHAFCALPLVRRAYQASVVALAIFFLTLVALREPFRGYLGEVQISGPATEGLDLEAAVSWLRSVDPEVAAVGTPAGEISAKSQIRVTYVALKPAAALEHLDELAERWLYQYLPDRLQAHRRSALAALRSAVQAAREREDAAQQRLEALRQQELALLVRAPNEPGGRPIESRTIEPQPMAEMAAPPEGRRKLAEMLETLKGELSRLLASQTEAHPQVVTVRSQIAAIEKELATAPGWGVTPGLVPAMAEPAASEKRAAVQGTPQATQMASHFVSAGGAAPSAELSSGDEMALAAAMNAAIDLLSQASRLRQAAEHRLSERMQEISSQPTAAQWSAAAAHVATRLGGTPRSSTLAAAGLFAAIAGVTMFRAAAVSVGTPRIATAGELAGALELPVVGNLSALRAAAGRMKRRLCTPGRVKAVLIAAEIVVAIAVAACLVAMAMEPALARQVLADPFGTLSEVIGRFTG